MPGLDEQKKLLEIMCAEDRLDITFSEDFQLQPEHSALYLYAHHPEAKCFSAP
jgi:5-methyltetrahydrofolate--homocysteine methyltransferase